MGRFPQMPLAMSACFQPTLEYRTVLPPVQRELLLRSDQAPLHGEFWAEPGIVRGHVEWTRTCTRAVVRQSQTLVQRKKRYSRVAGAAAGVGSLAVGAIGVHLVATADERSDEPHCGPDQDGDGYEDCRSSPRGEQAQMGLLLGATSLALAVVGIYHLAAEDPPASSELETAPPAPPEVVEEDTPCGPGTARDLRLSLHQGALFVAASQTDPSGDVAFAIPTWLTGRLDVVVDQVQPPSELVAAGLGLGSVVVEPLPANR